VAFWRGRTRPQVLKVAGKILATGESDAGEPELVGATTSAAPEAKAPTRIE
jgi:hypothetical protein